jgi:hypothetical protein
MLQWSAPYQQRASLKMPTLSICCSTLWAGGKTQHTIWCTHRKKVGAHNNTRQSYGCIPCVLYSHLQPLHVPRSLPGVFASGELCARFSYCLRRLRLHPHACVASVAKICNAPGIACIARCKRVQYTSWARKAIFLVATAVITSRWGIELLNFVFLHNLASYRGTSWVI